MRKVTREERRRRLGRRHFLATRADDPVAVTTRLVAIHSTDPATVYLSMLARVRDFQVGHLETLLYEKRDLIRHWAMRRTLWVVDRETLPLVVSASTRGIGDKERRRTVKLIEEGGVSEDGEQWLEAAIEKTLEKLRSEGEVLAREISRDIPELAEKVEFRNKSGKLMGRTGMSSRTLVQLGLESRVLRARPTGTWLSGQYRWAETESWLEGPIAEVALSDASARIVERWLGAFGPATETDVRWWTGWPVSQVRAALSEVDAVEVDLGDDGVGYVLPDDLDDEPESEPWAALLPSLDTTAMGWKERHWYVGDHESTLFDSNGNAGPTVWVDGRVVGGWAIGPDGDVRYEIFEDVGADAGRLVEERRDELQAWLGDTSVTPRFRSPHDKELSS